MRRIDQLAVKRYGLPVFLLMENAGHAVAEEVRRSWPRALGSDIKKGRRSLKPGALSVVVLCGSGHNGGDGVVAARYLRNWGYRVQVLYLKNPRSWKGDVAQHYQIAKRCGVRFAPFRHSLNTLRSSDLLIDALLGTGTSGEIRRPYRDAIMAMNSSHRPIVAVDIPSGLDADTGKPLGLAVKAQITVTMACAKKGLLKPGARPYVGKLVIADIGVPRSALVQLR
jgi:NAD(P)H-hydrate epimerase